VPGAGALVTSGAALASVGAGADTAGRAVRAEGLGNARLALGATRVVPSASAVAACFSFLLFFLLFTFALAAGSSSVSAPDRMTRKAPPERGAGHRAHLAARALVGFARADFTMGTAIADASRETSPSPGLASESGS
jgi:hypothetical protein